MFCSTFPQVQGPVAEFHGWEVLVYYFNNLENYFADYLWQVRTAYGLIIGCILVMMVLYVLFFLMIRKTTKYKKEYKKLSNNIAHPKKSIYFCNLNF